MITPDPATPFQVIEVFRSLQGESTFAGRPCTFIRLAGCPLRCHYCDTPQAWDPGAGRRMALVEILAEVGRLADPLVEVTGGEPLAQPATPLLLAALLATGRTVLLETSGAMPVAGVPAGVVRIVDLKTPDSGSGGTFRLDNLAALRPPDQLKIVVCSPADFEWAGDFLRTHPPPRGVEILLSPAAGRVVPADLAAWLLDSRLDARLQIQLHRALGLP